MIGVKGDDSGLQRGQGGQDSTLNNSVPTTNINITHYLSPKINILKL